MKRYLSVLLLVSSSLLLISSGSINAKDGQASYTGYEVDGRTSAYEVDGRTSASVLSAKRSHAVSSKDEIGLTVFSGVIVMGLIVFFAGLIKDKN
jgi:hypothetical protein